MNFVTIPGYAHPVTPDYTIPLAVALGLSGASDAWRLTPHNALVPAGTPVITWYQHARSLGGMQAYRRKDPLWTHSPVDPEATPLVVFVQAKDLDHVSPYLLPKGTRGQVIEVELSDSSRGVLVRGDKWTFIPTTTTDHYKEGNAYACDDGREFLHFLREEVVWWEDLTHGGLRQFNPKLKGLLNNDHDL